MTESRTNLFRIPVGTVLNDRYRITGFLGKGGFAAVYEGFDTVIERRVAVKVLTVQADALEEESYREKLERFRREAKASARIKHPNVVTVFDMGVIEDSRKPYIVMEVLEGHSLAEEIRENGRMHPERALPLFIKALEALGEAHKLGVVHKDLKPSNLFLVKPGTPHEALKVVDFGIARFDEDDAGLTGTGQVFGTARYFAPEYISQQLVTPRLDVYQMGLILVEMLAGLPAVRSNNPLECVMCHGSGRLEIPHSLLDGPLGQVILNAVALDHKERYEDATAFQHILAKVDPAFVSPVTTGEMTMNLDEISSNMRTVSGLSNAVTAHANILNLDPGTSLSDVVIDLSSSQVLASDDETNPEPITISEAFATYPAPKKSRWITTGALVAALVIAAMVVGVAAAALFFPDGEEPPQPTVEPAAPAVTPAPTAPEVDARPDERTIKAVEEVEKEELPPAREPQSVKLVSKPPGAAVIRDGKRVGMTPWSAEFEDVTADPMELTLRRNGYKAQRVVIAPNDGPSRSVTLKKIPPVAPKKKSEPARGIPLVR